MFSNWNTVFLFLIPLRNNNDMRSLRSSAGYTSSNIDISPVPPHFLMYFYLHCSCRFRRILVPLPDEKKHSAVPPLQQYEAQGANINIGMPIKSQTGMIETHPLLKGGIQVAAALFSLAALVCDNALSAFVRIEFFSFPVGPERQKMSQHSIGHTK